jgi:hypothetical protein
MSILKALQKKQVEQATNGAETPKGTVVPFDRNERLNSAKRANTPPGLFADEDFKIGTPSLAFNGQSDSLVGTALPDTLSEITAGATLNATGSTRIAEKRLPEFSAWTIEAERVEPHLVAITQPHSTYCEEYRNLRTQILHRS